MTGLTLNTFLNSAKDAELSKYKVLAALKKLEEMLHQNKLYPDFSELIATYNLLAEIVEKGSLLKGKLPEKLTGFDLENKKAVYQKRNLSEDKVNEVFEFINWAMPKMKQAIEEGKAIFDFIDENLKINEVGILPLYKKEGYFFLPDNENGFLRIFRFELTLFPGQNEEIHTLKTNHIKEIDADEMKSKKPETFKIELIEKYPDLPNPAAYNFNYEFNFPFVETILPIAKRKLLRVLAA